MRLIDADALDYPEYFYTREKHPDEFIEGFHQGKIDAITDIIALAPTVDAVEVVFCAECENHGNCYPETIFRLARIEKPFCCVGKRKTNTNCGAKMDCDGNA